MIIYPLKEHIPYLKDMWKSIFGDTDSYIDLFFNHRFSSDSSLVYIRDDRPISMLFFPQYDMKFYNQTVKAGYICGAATLPEYRSSGIMSEMIKYSFSVMKDRGDAFTVLIPASRGLYKYYERFGYKAAFYRGKRVFKRCNAKTHSVLALRKAISAEDIYSVYKRLISAVDIAVLQSQQTIMVNYLAYKRSGGEVWITEDNNGYCFAIMQKEGLYVKELICDDVKAQDIVLTLFDIYPKADTITVETTSADNLNKTGMAKILNKNLLDIDNNTQAVDKLMFCNGVKPYMNMMMD